jgi:vanillate O-demethylase ferredoxin subunit
LKRHLYRSLLPLHRWTGLTVGMVILFMAITGATLAFRPQLEPLAAPDLVSVPACSGHASLDLMTANAAALHPGATLDYIRLLAPTEAGVRTPAAMVRFTDQTFVYLDPCTGTALGQRHRYGGLFGTLEQLHRFRFMENGSLITGTSVLAFVSLLIGGGVILWWPASARGWRGTFTLDATLRGRALSINRHKVFGLIALPIVLTSALSGLPQACDWYRQGLYTITGSPQPPKLPKSAEPVQGAARLPMETLWQRAQAIVPDPQDVLIHYPRKPLAPVDMYMIERGAAHSNARTYLNLDAYTGDVLSFTPYQSNSAGHKLYFFLLSLHTGHVGGVFGQLLLMFGALCVPLLAWTGVGSYLSRRRQATNVGATVGEPA